MSPRRSTVNVLAPGFTADTDFFDSAGIPTGDRMLKTAATGTLVGRVGTTADMAAATVWLLSEDGGSMTGQVVSPNGGQILGRWRSCGRSLRHRGRRVRVIVARRLTGLREGRQGAAPAGDVFVAEVGNWISRRHAGGGG